MTSAVPGAPPGARVRPWLLAAAVLAATGGAGACSAREDGSSPDGSVRLFIAAARGGDRQAVFRRLGPRTRARVEEAAARGARPGGQPGLRPDDLVSVGWAPPAWEAATVRTVHKEEDDAEVEVVSSAGDRQTVRLVREGREWKIELPWR